MQGGGSEVAGTGERGECAVCKHIYLFGIWHALSSMGGKQTCSEKVEAF